ncbi:MAG: hypothetical protein ACTS41_01630 [Candidatus Hodgkinia cicadicola]
MFKIMPLRGTLNNINRMINVLNSLGTFGRIEGLTRSLRLLTLLNQTEDAPLVGKFRRLTSVAVNPFRGIKLTYVIIPPNDGSCLD